MYVGLLSSKNESTHSYSIFSKKNKIYNLHSSEFLPPYNYCTDQQHIALFQETSCQYQNPTSRPDFHSYRIADQDHQTNASVRDPQSYLPHRN